MQGTVKAHGRVLGFQVTPTNEQQMQHGQPGAGAAEAEPAYENEIVPTEDWH